MATCPECDAEIEIDQDDLEEMEVGDPWNCDACGSSLRVANLTPLEFDGDEDDDEDEDEEDDAEEAAETEDDDLDDDDEDDDDEKDGDWDE
jgi:DNA-directed RNA polymerase subunit M/transcription elongation factor TFIIS